MPIDFDDIFFEDKTESYDVPSEIITYLSKQLPKGFEYVQVPGKETLVLRPTVKEGTIEGLKLNFNDPAFKDFSPRNLTEALEYLYRTQQSIEMDLEDNDSIIINNEKIETSRLVTAPLQESESKVEKILVEPSPFPELGEIVLENEIVEERFKLKRLPYSNMHKSKFEANNHKGFKVDLTLDEIEYNLTIKFLIQFENIKSSMDMKKALDLYKAFLTRNLKINGNHISEGILNDANLDITAISESINLWDNILKIEEKLKVNFKPDNLNIDEALLIKKLYRCLVEDKYFKEYIEIKSFKMTDVDLSNIKELKEKLNEDGIGITIINDIGINLLGVQINLKKVSHLYDFAVRDIKILDITDNEILIIIDEEKSKYAYQSVKFFMTKDFERNNENLTEIKNAEEI